MNVTELQKKLLNSARTEAPDERVPFSFERRIMSRIAGLGHTDPWAWWSGALWRAAASCALLMLLLVGGSLWLRPNPPVSDLSQDFENTVLAAADQDQPADAAQ
jgi:hypothetical protein